MKKTLKKYKINECLEQLTVKEHRIAMKIIPGLLNVANNTFHNYRNIGLGEKQDIPYEKVKLMEILFDLKPGGLQNFDITGVNLKTMISKGQHHKIM